MEDHSVRLVPSELTLPLNRRKISRRMKNGFLGISPSRIHRQRRGSLTTRLPRDSLETVLSKPTHRQCWRSRVSPRGSSDRVLTLFGQVKRMYS
jgi:hypothetical protein